LTLKILSADFAAASKNSIKNFGCLLKIDITSVIDANENDHTSRRYSVVVFCFGDEICDDMPLNGSPYSIAKRRVPELILVFGSQPAGDVSHKSSGRLPLLSARPAVTLTTLKMAATNFCCSVNKGTMGVDSLPNTVTRQRRYCDLNPGPSAPESSTLTIQLPSHFDMPLLN